MRVGPWVRAALLGSSLASCATNGIRSQEHGPAGRQTDRVFFVHFDAVAVPLGCYSTMKRQFASGADCLPLVPTAAALFVEGDGPAKSRAKSDECYEKRVNGLAVGERELPSSGFSIWPSQNPRWVRRTEESIEGSAPGSAPSVSPAERELLIRVGRQALDVPAGYELLIRQTLSLDLDGDGEAERLVVIGFHSPLSADPSQDEIRSQIDALSMHTGLFLIREQIPQAAHLLHSSANAILGTVDLAGDGRLALWLYYGDSENRRYSLHVFQHGRLLPLGCFECGPGRGLRTECDPPT